MNKTRHWQDSVIGLVGVWLIVSPWILDLTSTRAISVNFIACGAFAIILAGLAMAAFRLWEEWLDVALGAWLAASPWILGFNDSRHALWNGLACGAVIIAAGLEHGIKHRTGHSLSRGPRVHGLGVNIDNLETRDTRSLIPGIGFTIEPGVYLPAFGCRSEINVYIDPAQGPVVTSVQQDELVRIG